MKPTAIPALVLAALLVLPGLMQTALAQSANDPAPSGAYPGAPTPDPEVEVAFWQSVKDSDDPRLYLAYLEQFPDGAFRVIARNRLDALWDRAVRAFDLLDQLGISLDDPAPRASGASAQTAAPGPAVVPAAPRPSRTPPSWELIRNTQNQLRAHGCYKGGVDGVWGTESERAMRRFNRRMGTSWSVKQPTQNALKSMRALTKSGIRICG